MTTLLDLRTQLTAKGYSQTNSTTEQQALSPLISIHLHPLITNPVVLIGVDNTTAKKYQEDLVTEAIKRR